MDYTFTRQQIEESIITAKAAIEKAQAQMTGLEETLDYLVAKREILERFQTYFPQLLEPASDANKNYRDATLVEREEMIKDLAQAEAERDDCPPQFYEGDPREIQDSVRVGGLSLTTDEVEQLRRNIEWIQDMKAKYHL